MTADIDLPGLAACPFCGGEAERVDIDPMQEEFANAGGSVIQCKSCGASSPVHFDRKENLDASWNTRAASAPDGVVVKPLEWSDPIKPDERCPYDHVKAQSSIGEYSVEWKGWKDYPGYAIYRDGDYFADGDDNLDSAKAAAQADYEQRIRSALIATPRPLPSVDDVARLIDPEAWSLEPWNDNWRAVVANRQEEARAKATAILTLLGGSAHGR